MTHSDKHLEDEWVCISSMKPKHAAGQRHILNHCGYYFSLLRASCSAKNAQFGFLQAFTFLLISQKRFGMFEKEYEPQ